jgi:hypothetical protein
MPDSHNAYWDFMPMFSLALDGFVAAARPEVGIRRQEPRKFRAGLNLSPPATTYLLDAAASGTRDLRAESNQNEIDQRDQGRCDARGHQGVVGPKVGLRVER